MTGSQATRRHRSLVSNLRGERGIRLNCWEPVACCCLKQEVVAREIAAALLLLLLPHPARSCSCFVPLESLLGKGEQLSVFSPCLCEVFTTDLTLVHGIFILLAIARVLKYFSVTSSAHAAKQQVSRSDLLAGAQRASKKLFQLVVLITVAATAVAQGEHVGNTSRAVLYQAPTNHHFLALDSSEFFFTGATMIFIFTT